MSRADDERERERRIRELLAAVAVDTWSALVLADRLEEKTAELRMLTAQAQKRRRND